jgi:hypothetical protein
MKKLLIFLMISFFSTQGFSASCLDGRVPVKSISADGTYFVYNCSGINKKTSTSNNSPSKGSEASSNGINE